MRVFQDSLSKGFSLRPGKFHFGDAGYGLSRTTLTPYRGTRYHLKDNRGSNAEPRNKRELFELALEIFVF